jgi:N-dimethylarginine dimethylaminohydrolase
MKVGAASSTKALQQHERFTQALRESGAQLITLPFVHGAYDSVFIKDCAIMKQTENGISSLIAQPFYHERKAETEQRRFSLRKWGVDIVGQARKSLEGGDLVVHPKHNKIFMGYGFRTEQDAAQDVAKFFNATVIPLQLKDPHFYHLDVALTILEDGIAFACKEAFTPESWSILQDELPTLVTVTKAEAMNFGLNWVEVNDTIIMGSFLPRLMDILRFFGKNIIYTPLDQFQLAGGSAACLVSKVHEFDRTIRQSANILPQRQVANDIVLR